MAGCVYVLSVRGSVHPLTDPGSLVPDWKATTLKGHRQVLQEVPSSVGTSSTVLKDPPRPVVPGHQLTILTVVGDLHLALLGPEHSLRHLADGVFVSQVTMEKVTGARLLHDVWSREACHFTEAVVAVYDRTVLHPGVGYDEFPVCKETKKCIQRIFTAAHLNS